MSTGSVFENNRTQAVRLPADTRFPPEVKKVEVRVRGHERVLVPLNHSWDSFFLSGHEGSMDDFLPERASQHQSDRESF
jgi:antitoxin VapB